MRLLALLLLIAGLALTDRPAMAEDIEIDDPMWSKLPDEEKAALEKRLKDAGAIDADDRIVYTGGEDNTISETNAGLLAALPAISNTVCATKHLVKLAACATESEPKRTQCREAENARYTNVKSACK